MKGIYSLYSCALLMMPLYLNYDQSFFACTAVAVIYEPLTEAFIKFRYNFLSEKMICEFAEVNQTAVKRINIILSARV